MNTRWASVSPAHAGTAELCVAFRAHGDRHTERGSLSVESSLLLPAAPLGLTTQP